MNDNPRRPLLALAVLVLSGCAALQAQNPVPAGPRPAQSGDSSTPAATPSETPAPPPVNPVPAAGGPSIATAGADYVLAPSDTLEMSVFHEPDLTTQTKVASDGSAQFPLIGEMKIAGKTLRDAREMIRRRYNADYLVEPQVYLNVVGYAQRKFTMLGQVAKPGSYDFPAGEHLTLLEAVGMAGGFTRLADQGGLLVKRSAQGSEQTLKVNAKKLNAKNGKPFELLSGDVITVGESWY